LGNGRGNGGHKVDRIEVKVVAEHLGKLFRGQHRLVLEENQLELKILLLFCHNTNKFDHTTAEIAGKIYSGAPGFPTVAGIKKSRFAYTGKFYT
jgi:hypothetical protein